MSEYTIATPESATDYMAGYEGFGEMISFTGACEADQIAITWRRMPPGTGGRGSYGHRHRSQEEIYLVLAGTVTFKVGDDVFEAGPQTAVRVAAQAWRSIHNDADSDAQLVIASVKAEDPGTEKLEDFWPTEDDG